MKLWSRWVAFLSHREDPAALAFARMVAGIAIAWDLLQMQRTAAAAMLWVDSAHGGMRPMYAPDWLVALGGATPSNVKLLMAIGGAAALMTAAGLMTRASIFVTWLCFNTLITMNRSAGGSADDLLVNGIFILFWSGCGRTLSIDRLIERRKSPAAPPPEAPAWPRYLLIYQLVTVYWTTGAQKVSNGWFPPPLGTLDALYYSLQMPSWVRFDLQPGLAHIFRVTQAATLFTWLFENCGLVLLLAFWFRYTRERPGRVRAFFNAPLKRFPRIDFRLYYLAFGFVLHLGIGVLMEVGPFFSAVMVCYCACIAPAEWRAAIGWLRRRLAEATPVPSAHRG